MARVFSLSLIPFQLWLISVSSPFLDKEQQDIQTIDYFKTVA